MKTSMELIDERTALLSKAETLLDEADVDDRALTEPEEHEYNQAVARIEALNTDIERREKLEDVLAKQLAMNPRVSAPQDGDVVMTRTPVITIPRSYGKLVAFKANPEGELRAYKSGMWIRASLYGDMSAQKWCREHGVGVQSALSGGVNTAGGVLVPEEFERAIIDLREQYGIFRRSVRVHPMGGDTRNVPRRTGGLTAYFVGEGVGATESDASWDNVQLIAKKLMVLTRMSSEIAEDAVIDLADQMAEEIAYAFALKEDTVGFTGTGISTDGGIVGVNVKAIDGNHALAAVDVATATHNLLTEIDANDLIGLMAAIPQYAKPGSAWYCSPTAEEVVFNAIKVAGGGNTRDMLADSDQPRFLGYPIMVSPVFPDNATTDLDSAVMLGFGNLRLAASLGDRRGITVGLSSERYWTEDQIGIKGTERFDINVHDLGTAAVKSPFAVLVGSSS